MKLVLKEIDPGLTHPYNAHPQSGSDLIVLMRGGAVW